MVTDGRLCQSEPSLLSFNHREPAEPQSVRQFSCARPSLAARTRHPGRPEGTAVPSGPAHVEVCRCLAGLHSWQRIRLANRESSGLSVDQDLLSTGFRGYKTGPVASCFKTLDPIPSSEDDENHATAPRRGLPVVLCQHSIERGSLSLGRESFLGPIVRERILA